MTSQSGIDEKPRANEVKSRVSGATLKTIVGMLALIGLVAVFVWLPVRTVVFAAIVVKSVVEFWKVVRAVGWHPTVVLQAAVTGVGYATMWALMECEWRWALVLLVSTIATDSFALFGGMGSRRLTNHEVMTLSALVPEDVPDDDDRLWVRLLRSSPNKTVEGAWTGVIAGAVFSWATLALLVIHTGFNAPWHVVVLVSLAPFIAVLGDLAESLMKRTANLKDTGNVLPGHGGILDRLDSHVWVWATVGLMLMVLLSNRLL